jgi:hypothetical protein
MKKYSILFSLLILISPIQINAQNQLPQNQNDVDFPEVPRISALEAYNKYKAGKAILLYGGGDKFERRHIVGSFNLDFKDRESMLRKFPKRGIEIFTYCY